MKILQIVTDGSPGGGTTFVLGIMDDLKSHENVELSFITQSDSYALQEAKKTVFTSNYDRKLINGVNCPVIHNRIDIDHLPQLKEKKR